MVHGTGPITFFFLRCERQCLNADGKKPVERKRLLIQGREEGQQMGQGLRGEDGPGGLPGSRVTAASTAQGGPSLSDSREEPILLSTPGSSGLWRFFFVVFKQVTHHL